MSYRQTLLITCAPAILASLSAPALAAEDESEVPVSGEGDVPTQGAQVYEPAYFDRYAPRNALDMLSQVPGFSINGGDNSSRGLGQATANVLINGSRLSSKSDGIRDQLNRISSVDVVRIEIVDGTTLDIPGLNGQVANIIVKTTGVSGQFRWNTSFRAHNAAASLFGGEISLSGKSGNLDYTVSLTNDAGRGGVDGPFFRFDGAGEVLEERDTKWSRKVERPGVSTNFTYTFSPNVVANLNMRYRKDFVSSRGREFVIASVGPDWTRRTRDKNNGPSYEIGGDIRFPLGAGQLKLIGLERFERDNIESILIDRFADDTPDVGSRFRQINGAGERIGRFEYGWNMWSAEWQLSGEAAFNRLDRSSSLADLDLVGNFVTFPFPAGNGKVTEDRYESTLSFTKQLSPALSLQATGGAEYSKIEQTGFASNSRTFKRPKGSVSLSWKPRNDFDVSVELRRRVGQLSFGDFLASVSLDAENANSGNNELVPAQSWNLETEINKSFGAWGSAKLQIDQIWFEDFVDFFPLANGGEARGNIGDARSLQVALSGTLKFDPIGWNGAQVNFRGVKRWMHVTDPFTGLDRPFSGDAIDFLDLEFRHDIPGSDWAHGASLYTRNNTAYSRRFEAGRYWEGPTWVHAFVEHKDIMGMTGRFEVRNILGARNRGGRTIYAESRPSDNVLFSESRDRRIGPLFHFTLSGNF